MSSTSVPQTKRDVLTFTVTATEPPAALQTVPDSWKNGKSGSRLAGVALISDQVGGANLTGAKLWVSNSDIHGGAAMEIGPLDAVIALSTTKGYFRRLFDVAGWEKIGISGTPSAGAVTAKMFSFDVDGAGG